MPISSSYICFTHNAHFASIWSRNTPPAHLEVPTSATFGPEQLSLHSFAPEFQLAPAIDRERVISWTHSVSLPIAPLGGETSASPAKLSSQPEQSPYRRAAKPPFQPEQRPYHRAVERSEFLPNASHSRCALCVAAFSPFTLLRYARSKLHRRPHARSQPPVRSGRRRDSDRRRRRHLRRPLRPWQRGPRV